MQAQTAELDSLLTDIRGSWGAVSGLPAQVDTIRNELRDVRRLMASRSTPLGHRTPGEISEEAAREIAATFVLHTARSGRLEALSSIPAQRDALLDLSAKALNLTTRAALTTAEIPLPTTNYGDEVKGLISEYGVVRRRMSPYPIGLGTAKPARMGTRPAFASIAMSGAFPEKAPGFSYASLESHKRGQPIAWFILYLT